MSTLSTALKMFFHVLGDPELAAESEALLRRELVPAGPPAEPRPRRSEALTLLAALQREGRLVDFLMEPLDAYGDAQVGTAARDVHRDCAAVVRRMFDPQPLRDEAEGSAIEVPVGYAPETVKLAGAVGGRPPYRGTLRHPGWRAGRCEVPEWHGGEAALDVVAPAEVEVG